MRAAIHRHPLSFLLLLFAAVFVATWAWSLRRQSQRNGITQAALDPAPASLADQLERAGGGDVPGAPLRWIIAGGGSMPELGQVQIEQDIGLASDVFGRLGPGALLFSGGRSSHAVQVAADDTTSETLRARLADLFDPRGGRDAVYRQTTLAPQGPASAEAILAAIEGAIVDSDPPLTVYLAGHGVGGEEPGDSRFLTWGIDDLAVSDLAEVLDEAPGHRPTRFVITSCYAGGFAEIAFEGADPERGVATTDRCGFFATTWDRAAAGCDPNPDRGAQEGYGIHFLHALRQQARDGSPLDLDELDVDHDGVISLLEAHTYARIVSGSLDVPVTTSERFLRAAVDPEEDPSAGPHRDVPLPEDRRVVARLSRRLELERPELAIDVLTRLHGELEQLAIQLDELDEALDDVEVALRASLLHRWPVLDDPWHPLFATVFASERAAIEEALLDSGLEARRQEAVQARATIAARHDDLLIEAAPYERLVRALETLHLATRLQAEGGSHWLRYQALLACERGAP